MSCFSFPKNLPVCSAVESDDGAVGAVVVVMVCEGVDGVGDGAVGAVVVVLPVGAVLVLVVVRTGPAAATPGCAALRQATYAGLHQ